MRRNLREMLELLEAEVFPPGTIRKWSSGPMIKLKDGTWVPYAKGGPQIPQAPDAKKVSKNPKPGKVPPPQALPIGTVKPATKAPSAAHPPAKSIESIMDELGAMHARGVLPVSAATQKKIAKKMIAKHKETLAESLDRLHSLVEGEGTAVMARVKELPSALGKVALKPKYGTAKELKDLTGMRVVCSSVEDVLKNVKKIKEEYETSAADEEDYINQPKGGYRSYHLIIKDKDGHWKELQVRTPNQDTWANWCHDVYKPQTPEQAKAVKEKGKDILKYGEEMSDYYYAKDKGEAKKSEPPKCPEVVKETFGCLPT